MSEIDSSTLERSRAAATRSDAPLEGGQPLIVEVGPRDGLQSEAAVLPVATRIDLIRRLEAAGASRIETVSFAHPKLLPQMAGAEEITEATAERTFSSIGLVLNARGMERAVATSLDEVNLVAYAADGYSEKNTGATATDRNNEAAAMIPQATARGLAVTVTISVAWGDPIEGRVAPQRVAEIAGRMAEAGADEIALGDTIGVAVPTTVQNLIEAVRAAVPEAAVRCHFHNTRNTGYANAVAALESGADALDGAVGGYGGSPFSPGAGGNVATEDLCWMLEAMRRPTGVDLSAMAETGRWLADHLGHEAPPAMLGRAAPWPPG